MTKFGAFLILVLMDLSSGYLLLEDSSDNRRVETWYAKSSPCLEALGIKVSHAISDHKDVMTMFRKQIKPLAVSVSFWWCWVSETLQGLAVDKDLDDWLTTTLLPVVYFLVT